MKKKNYFEPTMKLHELKTGRIMAASGTGTESLSKDYNFDEDHLFDDQNEPNP